MQRKPNYPVANCSIKMPDCSVPTVAPESALSEDGSDHHQRREQLINFGHSQWGFNNWSWAVTKQELDFVDFTNGKYCAGVVAFVLITVKSFDIHRENIGYATSVANTKGFAIYKSRKCAVTNALRETLLSFGGTVATELTELLEVQRPEVTAPANEPEPLTENNQNIVNRPTEPKNSPLNRSKKETIDHQPKNVPLRVVPGVKNATPVAKAHPMPANLAPPRPPLVAARPPPPPSAPRPNSNVSFVLQPVVGGVVPPIYRPPPPHMYPNAYYEYPGPWHFAYEGYDRSHGNVNLNFNVPPKNLVVNGRAAVDCVRQSEGEALHYAPQPPPQGCWIKPTIFYDGFWTEQKVKKWVAEQVEKQFPDDVNASPVVPEQPPKT